MCEDIIVQSNSTNLGRSWDAFVGRPAPSTIHGNCTDPLPFSALDSEMIISCNLACKV